MVWAKFDDKFPRHKKIRKLSDKAFRLHVSAICHAAEFTTDGLIEPDDDVVKGKKGVIPELVKSGLWDVQEDGSWIIHDFLDYNPAKDPKKKQSKSQAGSAGAAAKWGPRQMEHQATRAQRLAAARQIGTHSKAEWEEMRAFFACCLRCGEPDVDLVRDHIQPLYQGGSDSITNIQPLCRSCNASKGPDSTDFRTAWCEANACQMPGQWLARTPDSEGLAETPAPVPARPGPSRPVEDVENTQEGGPGGNDDPVEPSDAQLDVLTDIQAGLFLKLVGRAPNLVEISPDVLTRLASVKCPDGSPALTETFQRMAMLDNDTLRAVESSPAYLTGVVQAIAEEAPSDQQEAM